MHVGFQSIFLIQLSQTDPGTQNRTNSGKGTDQDDEITRGEAEKGKSNVGRITRIYYICV